MEENEKQSLSRNKKIQQALLKKPSRQLPVNHGVQKGKFSSKVSKAKRPLKEIRKVQSIDPKILLDTPSVSGRASIEYPTPSWFKTVEKADVSIIVPLYKSKDVLKDLIKSLDTENDGLKVEIIFVDDECPQNSKDAIVKHWSLRKKNEICKIYYNPINLGFGMTCNIGANHATGDYLIFLNADTLVTPHWIKPIIDLLKDPLVGIVGNLHIKKGGPWDGSIDSAGSEWSWSGMSFLHIGRHSYNQKVLPQPLCTHNAPKDILEISEREMVTGCCIGVRKNLFQEIGGFNPNYRVGYWEDSDLCLTVREKGYKIMFQPNSKIYHILGHSNSGAHKFQNYNRNFFFNKWVNTGRIDPLVLAKRESIPEVKAILLHRRGANGDVLLASAIAPALKKKHPGCLIYFSTKCKEVLDGNPYIDRVIEDKDVSERLFQVYYNLDMIYEYRPYTNVLEAYADAVGVKKEDCQLFLKTTKFNQLPKKYIVIHAGNTAWAGRNWSQNKFDDVSRRLISEGHFVVCVGKGDNLVTCDLDLRNKTTISELASIIKEAKLFIGVDSFPMHVAQTFDTPSVCFFGSIDPKLRLISPNIKAITAENLGCLGCHHRKPAPSVVTNTCETITLDCIAKVSVKMIWVAIEEKLNADVPLVLS